ncbi:MAG: acyltransferase [Ferruginibacter sp.]
MRVYFKNLDGIRFIAALLVILQHTSDYKEFQNKGISNIFRPYVGDFGSYGVTLFFVLSGYLIFYLLFAEKQVTNTISIKNFYIRRILRIWPLYIGFGLVLIFGIDYVLAKVGTPVHTPALTNLFYLCTFSINLQMLFAIPNKGIIELYWSVCIEEQFYLFAPWLVKKGYKKMLSVIIGLIVIGIASKFVLHYIELHYDVYTVLSEYTLKLNFPFKNFHISDHFNHNNPLYFFTLCRLDNFGFGALAAWIYFNKPLYAKVEKIVTNKIVQIIVVLFTFLYITHIIPEGRFINLYFFSTVPSILFAYIIMSASTGDFFINLENKPLKLLGKYSYGIYVFHAVVSELILVAFMKFLPANTLLNYDVLYPLTCIVCTAIVAALSYELYERHFMKLKQRFTIVKNHDT